MLGSARQGESYPAARPLNPRRLHGDLLPAVAGIKCACVIAGELVLAGPKSGSTRRLRVGATL